MKLRTTVTNKENNFTKICCTINDLVIPGEKLTGCYDGGRAKGNRD